MVTYVTKFKNTKDDLVKLIFHPTRPLNTETKNSLLCVLPENPLHMQVNTGFIHFERQRQFTIYGSSSCFLTYQYFLKAFPYKRVHQKLTPPSEKPHGIIFVPYKITFKVIWKHRQEKPTRHFEKKSNNKKRTGLPSCLKF